jgi:hypothetical protein
MRGDAPQQARALSPGTARPTPEEPLLSALAGCLTVATASVLQLDLVLRRVGRLQDPANPALEVEGSATGRVGSRAQQRHGDAPDL